MKALALLIMRSRLTAAGIAGLLGLSGFALPLALLPSGAAIGLYTLRRGPNAGCQVMLLAFAATLLAAQILGAGAEMARLGIGTWIPAWLLASVLRRSSDQGVALCATGGIAALFVLGVYAMEPEPGSWWTGQLEALRAALPEQGRGTMLEQMDMTALGMQLTAALATYIVGALFAMLLLARWWQALLYNAGGFRAEFHALALPRWMGYVALALVTAALIGADGGQPTLATDLLHVAVTMFAVQGLAVAHFQATTWSLASVWLVPVYLLVLYAPSTLAVVGIGDWLLDLRRLRRAR